MNAPQDKYVLTEEQKRLIEQQRAKALKLREEVMKRKAEEQNRTILNDPQVVLKNVENKPNILNRSSSVTTSINKPQVGCKLKGKCILISHERFMIDIAYHQKMIDLFKKVPSRSYDAALKKWSFLLKDHDTLMKSLLSLKTEIEVSQLPNYVIRALQKYGKPNNEIDLTCLEPSLLQTLYPFQVEGIRFVISRDGRALIADDMGLGKTIQAIAVASYYQKDWPLLVITPSSMRYSWLEAFKRWMPNLSPSEIVVADNSKERFTNATLLIISYDLLSRKGEFFKMRNFGVVIVDESHFLKNFKTSRTKAAFPILKQAKRVIMLSGTPALSRPVELFTQLSAIDSTLFPSFHEFGLRYCCGKKMAWGWDYNGATNMTELQYMLESTIVIRRLKSVVMNDLPSKQREMVILDPDKVEHHKSMKSAAVKWNETSLKGMEKRGALLQYFHETGFSKMKAVSEYVIDQVESGKKFLCFAHHEAVMNCICEYLINQKVEFIRIDGKASSQERKTSCDKFQNSDRCRVAVLSITAANMGLTLTAAQFVLFGELFWNPGVLSQAEDRCHRIGQRNSVLVQYLVAKMTADDYLWPLVQRKLDVLNKAGLSKDNFQDIDMKVVEQSKQKTLDDLDWLEELDDNVLGKCDAPIMKKLKTEF